MEKVTYAWKNKISLTMIYADSVSLFISIDDRIQKYSSMFGFPWTNSWVNSLWYIKNECSAMA